LLLIATIITSIAGWVNHVIICIQDEAWILLAFGCIVAPIGVLHGIGSWFGLF
jgi:hypothetical protein